MAANTEPIFTKAPISSVSAVSAANTARDGTGTIVDIVTAGADGARIDEIVVESTSDPADSIVTIFIHNGAAYFLFDEFDLANPAAGSTTVAAYRESRLYNNLVLAGTYKLAAAITVAPTAGVVNVWALGGQLAA